MNSDRGLQGSSLPSAHSDERICLTGATGFLGRQVLIRLYRRFPEARFLLPVRDHGGKKAEQRIMALVAHAFPPEDRAEASRRIEALPADLSRERWGLTHGEYERIVGQVSRVIHAAADVSFDQSLADSLRVNVGSTKHILRLAISARRRGNLKSLTYVGTAFVAGRRMGRILEDELEAGQEFRNHYERSKAEAERLVRDAMSEVPSVIVRPSIIVGDSRNGVTSSFKALYWPLRIYASRRWRLVPGFSDAIVDMVPVDYVADAIAHLAFDPRAVGRCIHLCAGPEGCASLGQIASYAAAYFGLAPPRFVNPMLFLTLLKPFLFLALWDSRRKILKTGRVYRPYFSMSALFDTSVACELLAPAGIQAPPVKKYLESLFRYCLESDWGRRRVQGNGTHSPSGDPVENISPEKECSSSRERPGTND